MNVWRLWIVDTQKVQNISTYPTFDLLAHIVHITSGLVVCRSRAAWLCAARAWCRPPAPLPALTPAPAPAAWAQTPAPPPAGSGTAAGWRSPLQQETQALYILTGAELKLYAGSKQLLPLLSDAGSRGKEIFLKPVFISEKFAMVNLQKLTFFISSYFQRKFYPCIKLNIKSRRSRTRRGCWLGNTSKGRIHVMPWVIVHAYKYKYST